jgi:drug/metabolite transporter (DMT)-like permease
VTRPRTSVSARPKTFSARQPGVSAAPGLIWLALGSVYVIWGSTYLAIAVAIRTLPPFLMASARFLIAGALLYAWAIRRGDRSGDRPTGRQWLAALIIGGLLLLGGNGGVVWAEQHVPSSIAALIIALVPLWMALIDRLVNGQRLAAQAIVGLVIGFAGLVLLVGGPGGRFNLAGVFVLLLASLSWAIGSIYQRIVRFPARALVAIAMEMLGGGLLLGVVGVATGELGQAHLSQVSGESLLGLGYLIVFGSWIGFSAYLWLLRVAPVSLVGTYAYVNPVVAVFLGWWLLSEPITLRTLGAAAVILAGVALIVTARAIPLGDRSEDGAGRTSPPE